MYVSEHIYFNIAPDDAANFVMELSGCLRELSKYFNLHEVMMQNLDKMLLLLWNHTDFWWPNFLLPSLHLEKNGTVIHENGSPQMLIQFHSI